MLAPCLRAYGFARYISGEPALEEWRDVLFAEQGLYDRTGQLIVNSSYFSGVRFPHRQAGEPWQDRSSLLKTESVYNLLEEPNLVWGGVISRHYGHFLLDTLSRLWPLLGRDHDFKVLFWTGKGDKDGIREFWSEPYIRAIFEAIGLTPERTILMSAPTRIQRILIPEVSFSLNSHVYYRFRELCSAVGNRIVGKTVKTDSNPVYISKAALTHGTARITNEDRFLERLTRAGVDIFYPECHSLEEQIRLWRSRSVVLGYLGSGMHTAVFSESRRSVVLNHEAQVYSNQILIDALFEHDSDYLYAPGMKREGASENFQLNFTLPDPEIAAEQFLRELDRPPVGSPRKFLPGFTVDHHHHANEPLGDNISRGCQARQSSLLHPHSIGVDEVADATNALSGTLPDRYAFHTALEDNAWWEVDFAELCHVQEIRIFNRLDIGQEHARSFRILSTSDDMEWHECHRRVSDQPFGDGDVPYRWLPEHAVPSRRLRIELLTKGYLHLKQVEVFGVRPLTPPRRAIKKPDFRVA